MEFKNKNILVLGLAKTGLSIIKYLNQLDVNITVNDIKSENELSEIVKELKKLKNINIVLGEHIEDISNIDLVIISPGIPLDSPFVKKLKNEGIEIIGDIELSYRIWKTNNIIPNIVSITGTNGKTTTTSLIGELFNNAHLDTHIVGNIGNPIIDTMDSITKNSNVIAELSSFQLESVAQFTSNISIILNITPDHLNRHHNMENYIKAKTNILLNHTKENIAILNYDDLIVRDCAINTESNIYYFSVKEDLSKINKKGIYVDENGFITINLNNKIVVMHSRDVSLPGVHNLQNILATILIGYISDIDLDIIKSTMNSFKGVEHRQEFVKCIKGVRYINDSKATNPDSTIKALNSYSNPIILIAGGMDKKSNFKELAIEICKYTKGLIVYGETASEIQKQTRLAGYEYIISKVKTLEEAVKLSHKLAKADDIVLLSPACASWDMYKNFEERGNEFKTIVNNL